MSIWIPILTFMILWAIASAIVEVSTDNRSIFEKIADQSIYEDLNLSHLVYTSTTDSYKKERIYKDNEICMKCGSRRRIGYNYCIICRQAFPDTKVISVKKASNVGRRGYNMDCDIERRIDSLLWGESVL